MLNKLLPNYSNYLQILRIMNFKTRKTFKILNKNKRFV